VEILKDVAFRAIPLSQLDAESMVDQLKARKVLEGARGEPPADKAALVDLLLKVSGIVSAYPQISELDLNPVIAYPDGYAAVDARIIINRSVL
ncbi:MAG: acetyl-CoA synthetase, partial [Betaproteobacteria bacterium HGW-Betaproteobacteria-21]